MVKVGFVIYLRSKIVRQLAGFQRFLPGIVVGLLGLGVGVVGLGLPLPLWGAPVSEQVSSDQVGIVWNVAGTHQELKSWSLQELRRFKKYFSNEKDPATGQMAHWEGLLLSQLVDRALEQLPLENRAQVDLLVLKGKTGQKAIIPRSLAGKYPLLLAFRESQGSLSSIMPWSSKPKILKEDLPLESFFIPQITKIELTNYQTQFSPLFLKRRTDPSAMRGEKLFVQHCVNCHNPSPVKNPMMIFADASKEERFALQGHPPTKVSIKLSERDRKSILRYLNAHHTENSPSVSQSGGTQGTQIFSGLRQQSTPPSN